MFGYRPLGTTPLATGQVSSGGGPTTYNQSATVVCASAVSVKRGVGKLLAAACGSSVLGPVRAFGLNISVAVTSSVTATTNFFAGSIQYSKSIAVACATTVSSNKSVHKILAVLSTSTLTANQLKAKLVSILVGCATAVTTKRQVFKGLAINCSSSITAVGKSITKTLALGVAGATAAIRQTRKSIALSVSGLVVIQALKARVVAISITCATTLNARKQVLKGITSTVSSAIAQSRAISKINLVLSAATINLGRAIDRTLLVAAISNVIVNKRINKALQVVSSIVTSILTFFKPPKKTALEMKARIDLTEKELHAKLDEA